MSDSSTREASGPGPSSGRGLHEQRAANAVAWAPAVAVAVAVLELAEVVIALGVGGLGSGLRIAAGMVTALVVLVGPGFVVVRPNESRVLILFGLHRHAFGSQAVQMALAQLADSDLVELDPERKAAMVANLMVVLSGDHSPTRVINTGSLYT